MLIQFGHNDVVFNRPMGARPAGAPSAGAAGSGAPPSGRAVFGGDRALTDPGEYEKNLRQYVTEARAAGIKPILVTPITRQYFEADKDYSDQTEHSETMRRVAADMKVPLIELQNESIAYLESVGEGKGTSSRSPRRMRRVRRSLTRRISTGRGVTCSDGWWLSTWTGLTPGTAEICTQGRRRIPLKMRSDAVDMEGSPAQIVLVGDSTVAIGGGWGLGFCAGLYAEDYLRG